LDRKKEEVSRRADEKLERPELIAKAPPVERRVHPCQHRTLCGRALVFAVGCTAP